MAQLNLKDDRLSSLPDDLIHKIFSDICMKHDDVYNHEQPTPSHPKSDVRNTTGKNKQTLQDSVRTTSAVDLEEFCEKHYEKLLPIMADKYEYEKKKKEKMEEIKMRLDFGDAGRRALGHRNQRILSPGQYRQEDRDAFTARATILASSLS
ncbi:hypothetical protein Tco_0290242 [Tanacetum coccineum]